MANDQLPKNTPDLKPTLKGARPYFSVSIPQQLGVPCTQRHLRSCLLLYCYPFILIFVLCNYHESLLDAVYWQTFGPYEIFASAWPAASQASWNCPGMHVSGWAVGTTRGQYKRPNHKPKLVTTVSARPSAPCLAPAQSPSLPVRRPNQSTTLATGLLSRDAPPLAVLGTDRRLPMMGPPVSQLSLVNVRKPDRVYSIRKMR